MEIIKDKSKKKTTFKTVLSSPVPFYWPEISKDEAVELQNIILNIINQLGTEYKNISKMGITLGLSACIRKLKNEKLSCLLLHTEIQPKFIAEQIINLTTSNYSHTKVLRVPGLKKLTLKAFNIESIAVGIAKQMAPDIENWIINKSVKFSISNQNDVFSSNSQSITTGIKVEESKSLSERKSKEKININSLYLKRPNKLSRAFIPENANNLKPLSFETNNFQEECSDYISLSGKTFEKCKLVKEQRDSNEKLKEDNYKLLSFFKDITFFNNVDKTNSKSDRTTKEYTEMRDITDEQNIKESSKMEESTENTTNKEKKGKQEIEKKERNFSHVNTYKVQDQPNFKYISLKAKKIRSNLSRKKIQKSKN